MDDTHAVDDNLYDDDGIYLGPDRCVGDRTWIDSWEREHEASCIERGVITCCGEHWCMDCHEEHLDLVPHADPTCWWCMDTGVIVGHFGQVDRCYWRCPASGLSAP